jgi:DNA primase
LEEVLLEAKKQAIGVKLCFDKDEAGEKMVKQVISIVSKQGVSCQVQWPSKGKDWNDMLLASKEQVAQVDKQKSSVLLGRSL